MKKLLPFLKSHWIIPVCLVVPIGAIVAGWIFSSGWNASIRQQVEDSVAKDTRALDGLTQSFEIPPLDPDDPAIGFSMVPNKATVEKAGEVLQSNIDQSERIVAMAQRHNRTEKSMLIDGPNPEDALFPQPVNTASRLRKLSEIKILWPEAHAALLDEVQAGPPRSAEQVIDEIGRFREQQVGRLLGDRVDQTLSEDEAAIIDQRVSEHRVEMYRARAAELAYYASAEIFAGVHAPEEADAIGQIDLATAWEWQHRYWVHEEVLRALREAASDASGLHVPVFRSPVKRVLSVEVEPWDFASADTPPTPSDATREIARDFSVSMSGLTSWPATPNALYDTRDATVVLHAASKDINRILDTVVSSNFIRILDMDLRETDEFAALEQGYDYGTDHVVELTLTLETVWLRSWTSRSMPPAVRQAMGVPEPQPEQQEEQAS